MQYGYIGEQISQIIMLHQKMIQPVIIGGTGHTRNTFTFFAQGSYTATVEIGGDTVEKYKPYNKV